MMKDLSIQPSPASAWRSQAMRIVEALFVNLESSAWDDLLDLRQALQHGADLTEVLRIFYHCRRRYETQQYLPFYRLRKTLEYHLRLETQDGNGQRAEMPFMLWPHEELNQLTADAQEKHFHQHQGRGPIADPRAVLVRVVEVTR